MISQIGRGNYGSVFLCDDLSSPDERRVVVKQVSIFDMADAEREQAKQEVILLSCLKHPSIVEYYDSFIQDGHLHIVMEYCQGGDLASAMKEARRKKMYFSEAQVLDWIAQLCLAVQYMHSRLVLHRDLKSQNVFLTADNTVRLGDFGIARVLEHTFECAKTVVGTPYYMSPEVCENKAYDAKSDLWALGCVLYELCTLSHAFQSANLLGLVYKIVAEKPPPIPSLYSRELAALVDKMLSKDPAQRLTCDELLMEPFIAERLRLLVLAAESPVPESTAGLTSPQLVRFEEPAAADAGPALPAQSGGEVEHAPADQGPMATAPADKSSDIALPPSDALPTTPTISPPPLSGDALAPLAEVAEVDAPLEAAASALTHSPETFTGVNVESSTSAAEVPHDAASSANSPSSKGAASPARVPPVAAAVEESAAPPVCAVARPLSAAAAAALGEAASSQVSDAAAASPTLLPAVVPVLASALPLAPASESFVSPGVPPSAVSLSVKRSPALSAASSPSFVPAPAPLSSPAAVSVSSPPFTSLSPPSSTPSELAVASKAAPPLRSPISRFSAGGRSASAGSEGETGIPTLSTRDAPRVNVRIGGDADADGLRPLLRGGDAPPSVRRSEDSPVVHDAGVTPARAAAASTGARPSPTPLASLRSTVLSRASAVAAIATSVASSSVTPSGAASAASGSRASAVLPSLNLLKLAAAGAKPHEREAPPDSAAGASAAASDRHSPPAPRLTLGGGLASPFSARSASAATSGSSSKETDVGGGARSGGGGGDASARAAGDASSVDALSSPKFSFAARLKANKEANMQPVAANPKLASPNLAGAAGGGSGGLSSGGGAFPYGGGAHAVSSPPFPLASPSTRGDAAAALGVTIAPAARSVTAVDDDDDADAHPSFFEGGHIEAEPVQATSPHLVVSPGLISKYASIMQQNASSGSPESSDTSPLPAAATARSVLQIVAPPPHAPSISTSDAALATGASASSSASTVTISSTHAQRAPISAPLSTPTYTDDFENDDGGTPTSSQRRTPVAVGFRADAAPASPIAENISVTQDDDSDGDYGIFLRPGASASQHVMMAALPSARVLGGGGVVTGGGGGSASAGRASSSSTSGVVSPRSPGAHARTVTETFSGGSQHLDALQAAAAVWVANSTQPRPATAAAPRPIAPTAGHAAALPPVPTEEISTRSMRVYTPSNASAARARCEAALGPDLFLRVYSRLREKERTESPSASSGRVTRAQLLSIVGGDEKLLAECQRVDELIFMENIIVQNSDAAACARA